MPKTANSPRRERIDKQTRNAVYARDKGICQLCGKPTGAFLFHLDHRKPVKAGGTNLIHNLRLTCAACNEKRGAPKPVNGKYTR